MNFKKLTKRILASFMAVMLTVGCFIVTTMVVGAAGGITVNIHYLRWDGAYNDWDVWAWTDSGAPDGEKTTEGAYVFDKTNPDENGVVCRLTLSEPVPRLGFIVRKPNWSAKDYDEDLFVDLSDVFSGTVEVYYKSGNPNFETKKDNIISIPDYSSNEFESQYTYEGDDLGASYSRNSTFFRVWAPTAKRMELNIYNAGNGGTAADVVEMKADVKGTWVATVQGDLNKKYYTYTAYFDGMTNKDIVDPYAKSVGINGQRGQILDMSSTNPDNWDSDSRHTYKSITDLDIYEVHIRDFSIAENSGIKNKGKYLAFTERGTTTSDGTKTGVDHLVDLGVTSVHILPSYDFGSVDETKGGYNWGYDPVNYNAPEGSYSTDPYHGEVRVNEYKQMVQGLHDAGIGVIMDVVYNHTLSSSYCFNQLVPGYFHRPGSNGSGCGNDVASERSMVSKFIVDSVKYWAEEYHLDGFRFDLMGLIDVNTMNAIRKALDKIDPTIVIYGEGWTMSTLITKNVPLATQTNARLTPGIAYFSDNIRDNIKGSVFDVAEKGYINGEISYRDSLVESIRSALSWAPSPSQVINYADCHDNYTLWDEVRSSSPYDTLADQIRQNNLGAAIVQTAMGTPFIMSGEEFLRTKTKKDGTFDHNSYASGDEVNKLDYSLVAQNKAVYDYYKGLIAFRKAHPALRLSTSGEVSSKFRLLDSTEKGVIAYTLSGDVEGEPADQILVVYNPLKNATNVWLPDGEWKIYVNDTKAGASDVIASVSGEVSVPRISAMILVKGDNKTELVNDSTVSATSITLGNSVTISGKASGGTAPYTYSYYYKKSTDTNWVTKSENTTNTSVSFKPGAATNYDIKVTVRDSEGTTKDAAFTLKVTGGTSALVNNSTVSSTSITLGNSVTISGKASGGTAPYTYSYYYKKSTDTNWVTKQANTTAASISFKPGTATTYNIKVMVKDSKGTTKDKTFTVNVTGSTSTLVNNSTVSASSITLGNSVTISGKASGGTSPYTYSYYYKKSTDTNWVTKQANTTATSISFKPGTATTYNIKVTVKDSKGTTKDKTFTVNVTGSTSTLVNNSTVSASSITLGNSVTISGKASGGTSPYTYSYYYKKSTDKSWVVKQANTSSTSVTFKPGTATTYDIKVTVTDVNGATKDKTFNLEVAGNTSVLKNNSTVSSTSITLGNSVTISGKASGGAAPYTYSYYYKKSTDTNWVTKTANTNITSVSFRPGSAVSYDVKILVKDSRGTTAEIIYTISVR